MHKLIQIKREVLFHLVFTPRTGRCSLFPRVILAICALLRFFQGSVSGLSADARHIPVNGMPVAHHELAQNIPEVHFIALFSKQRRLFFRCCRLFPVICGRGRFNCRKHFLRAHPAGGKPVFEFFRVCFAVRAFRFLFRFQRLFLRSSRFLGKHFKQRRIVQRIHKGLV